VKPPAALFFQEISVHPREPAEREVDRFDRKLRIAPPHTALTEF
jgi:hypothetical protein